jgi:hypothetical protein
MAARFARIRKTLANGLPDPRWPLVKPNREQFAQMVANGVPVAIAYERAGYKGGDDSRSQLRRSADVDQRVTWLIQQRIDSDTRARRRQEKPIADLKGRVVRELERLAFSDVRAVAQWGRRPVIDVDGNVAGFQDELIATPSDCLTSDAAAAVRSVTTKAGSLRVDVFDKIAALDRLGRMLGLFHDAAPAPSSVNVTQVNVGESNAFEAARRLAFALASAQAVAAFAPVQEPSTIDAQPV